MLLNGITMLSCDMVKTEWEKPGFQLSQLWDCIGNGTLENFERSLNPPPPFTGEILSCLQNPDQRLRWDQMLAQLNACDADRTDRFLSQNEATLQPLRGRTDGQLYLFLLLHLQIKPREAIRPQDVAYMMNQVFPASQAQPSAAPQAQSRIAFFQNTVLRCMGSKIERLEGRAWKTVWESGTPLKGFCCLEPPGAGASLIVFDETGTLCGPTPDAVIASAQGKPIVMASAFGRHYILLGADGTVITNMTQNLNGWTDVTWVHMGVNSMSGICGTNNSALEYQSDKRVANYSGVRSVDTLTADGKRRFAVLCADHTLHLDSGQELPDVAAACLSPHGYLYVTTERALCLLGYDGSQRQLCTLPDGLTAEELHARDNLILCGSAERFYISTI